MEQPLAQEIPNHSGKDGFQENDLELRNTRVHRHAEVELRKRARIHHVHQRAAAAVSGRGYVESQDHLTPGGKEIRQARDLFAGEHPPSRARKLCFW